MTTRELNKAIGVAGYEPLVCWRKEGFFDLRLAAPAACYRCPRCGNRDVIRRGQGDRMVHAPRIGRDRTVLFIKTPRLECRICQRVLNAVLPNVVPKCNDTKSFARIVVDLRKMMTIRDVARYLGVGEGMIRGIDKS
jgi:transposase